jgi:predicted lactoylglutathione lyase
MSGIVFFGTAAHDAVIDFYVETVGAEVWLEQPGCTILRHGEFRFGFCEREETDDCGIVTFVYDTREEVDEMHERVGDAARESPHENERYRIYQFFAEDPDGRTVEFQTFLHETAA